MATGVSIDSVTTADVAPAAAPYRISAKATKDAATIKFTPHDDPVLPLRPGAGVRPGAGRRPRAPRGPRNVRAVRFVLGGSSAYSGVLLDRLGLVCSESLACSETLACSDWESPSGTQLTEAVTYAETGAPADGAQTISVWAAFGDGAWV